jgi:glycine dehydrogenase subunit 2
MSNKNSDHSGIEVHEAPIFMRSSPGVSGLDFNWPKSNDSQALAVLEHNIRSVDDEVLLPEVTESEAVRHFTRLSKKNCAIDVSSYPLGSCTMKYNPKLHEWAARLPGLSALHPYSPVDFLQPALKIIYELEQALCEIAGFAQCSLAPSAGAQGEFAGLAMMTKAVKSRGEKRHKILVPKSAHGTNPATAAFFGYEVTSLNVGPDGRMIYEEVASLMDELTLGIMLTNPNTLGIFESDIKRIVDLVHARGGYVYADGANLNALMGISRPGDWGVDCMHFNLHKTMTTPHGGGGPGCGAIGAAQSLAPYLPVPLIVKNNDRFEVIETKETSIGRIRSFYSNFGMIVRAWTYVQSLGAEGLKDASVGAVLNANYVKEKLRPYFHLPFDTDCLHEVVFSDQKQNTHGINALDIAKRLIDYGIHPPTMYFPLVVKGALMIEPTETESLYDLDAMINAFIAVAKEAETNPELLKTAPHSTALARLDEAKAAREPRLTFQSARDCF